MLGNDIIIRNFFIVRSNGVRPKTDNKAKLRQDLCNDNISAASQTWYFTREHSNQDQIRCPDIGRIPVF